MNDDSLISVTKLKEFSKLQTSARFRINNNALVEGKNASAPRKQIGHAYIPKKYAPLINIFCTKYLRTFTDPVRLQLMQLT